MKFKIIWHTLCAVPGLASGWRGLSAAMRCNASDATGWRVGGSAVLAVSSAVLPAERNHLLNPAHPDFARIIMGEPEAPDTDFRLMRPLSAGEGADAASRPAPP